MTPFFAFRVEGIKWLSISTSSDPLSLVRDHRMKEVLTSNGIAVPSFHADLLYEPWEVLDDEGHPFNIFTKFWGRCLSMPYDLESQKLLDCFSDSMTSTEDWDNEEDGEWTVPTIINKFV
ncbi:hypothetical protein L1887_18579 [Cichorium endivia]|nr:hypothetical protein L1887_18579 [Cichorium endivia]